MLYATGNLMSILFDVVVLIHLLQSDVLTLNLLKPKLPSTFRYT